jgi:serine/threonine protein kinase
MQEPPEKIDKYQILSVLGKGAMGVVYHGYDPIVKRDVAIKFLSSLGSEETELISRFEREARLAGGLRHPNIVTIYDLGHHEGRPYIVMEYIVGKDLQTIIKQKQELTFEQKVEIILQICKGLEAAHQKGIIHRDIKPANIRIQEDYTVKIMDFGIARMGASELTRSGYIIGTLQYMSPEQISGDQLDPRTDIFSAGVIGYELFTFNNPFNGEHTVDIMYRILNVRPQPIQNLPEEFGTELNQILMRALEKNRDLRFPSAKEMGQDLEEYLFYLKSLKFRRRTSIRQMATTPESLTQILPAEPVSTQQGTGSGNAPAPSLPPAPAPVPVAPPTTMSPSQGPFSARPENEIQATVTADVQNMPTFHMPAPTPNFGMPEPQKAPRTGLGANYSETAQVLMKQPTFWQEKKFFILGAIAALLFIGGVFYLGSTKKQEPAASIPGTNSTSTTPAPNTQTPATIPPPPPSLVHTVKVETVPVGASITIDGQDVGKTPTELKIKDSSSHELNVQLEGYQPLKQTVDNKSPETLSLTLEPVVLTGFVKYVGSHPVTVYSAGKALRGNPVELNAGNYTLSFRSKKEAFIRFSQKVEVKPGETTVVKGPTMGSLNVRAVPSNCKISIDGEFVDFAPIQNLAIQSGNHMILFNWEKMGKTLNKEVSISGGQSQTVTGVPE